MIIGTPNQRTRQDHEHGPCMGSTRPFIRSAMIRRRNKNPDPAPLTLAPLPGDSYAHMANLTLTTADIEAGESTPLLSKRKKDKNGDDPAPLRDIPEHTGVEKAVGLAAGAGVGANIASIILNPFSVAVKVSGAVGTVLGPYCALQQSKITETKAMKETCDRLASEVQNLKVENGRLGQYVDDLGDSVTKLQDVEHTLEEIRALDGASLSQLEKQLKETELIYNSMEENLKSNVLQNLVTVVLDCDNDGDMILSDDEIDALIEKTQGLYGINVKDEEAKKLIIANGRSINALMGLMRNLLDDSVPPAERLFTVEEEKS